MIQREWYGHQHHNRWPKQPSLQKNHDITHYCTFSWIHQPPERKSQYSNRYMETHERCMACLTRPTNVYYRQAATTLFRFVVVLGANSHKDKLARQQSSTAPSPLLLPFLEAPYASANLQSRKHGAKGSTLLLCQIVEQAFFTVQEHPYPNSESFWWASA